MSAVLEPGRSVKTEKPAILDDSIRMLTHLRAEHQELKEANEKLLEEIKCLKVSNSFNRRYYAFAIKGNAVHSVISCLVFPSLLCCYILIDLPVLSCSCPFLNQGN